MKNLVVGIALVLSSITSSFAGQDPEIRKMIRKKMNIDLSEITLDAFKKEYVFVQFKIQDGAIQIVNIEGSQNELVELVTEELKEIHLKTPYNETDIHSYNFTFRKE